MGVRPRRVSRIHPRRPRRAAAAPPSTAGAPSASGREGEAADDDARTRARSCVEHRTRVRRDPSVRAGRPGAAAASASSARVQTAPARASTSARGASKRAIEQRQRRRRPGIERIGIIEGCIH